MAVRQFVHTTMCSLGGPCFSPSQDYRIKPQCLLCLSLLFLATASGKSCLVGFCRNLRHTAWSRWVCDCLFSVTQFWHGLLDKVSSLGSHGLCSRNIVCAHLLARCPAQYVITQSSSMAYTVWLVGAPAVRSVICPRVSLQQRMAAKDSLNFGKSLPTSVACSSLCHCAIIQRQAMPMVYSVCKLNGLSWILPDLTRFLWAVWRLAEVALFAMSPPLQALGPSGLWRWVAQWLSWCRLLLFPHSTGRLRDTSSCNILHGAFGLRIWGLCSEFTGACRMPQTGASPMQAISHFRVMLALIATCRTAVLCVCRQLAWLQMAH